MPFTRKLPRFGSLGATLLVLASLSAFAPAGAGVEVKVDEENDFSGYATYAFREGTPTLNPDYQREIEAAITRQLDAIGMQRVDSAPDFYVVTHAWRGDHSRGGINPFDYYGRLPGMGPGASAMIDITTGTLWIDILNGADDMLVWRGQADEKIDSTSPKKVVKKINKIVGKILGRFPPE